MRVAARRARACRPSAASASPPARRWPTSPGSPRRATRCSPARAGTSRSRACTARRRCGVRRRGGARDAVARAAAARDRARAGRGRAGRRPGRDARRRAAPRRPGDRVRAGGQRQQRRDRPARRRSPPPRASTARGCTSTAPSACGPPPARRWRELIDGPRRRDSWATDGHKWLNVPYDCGVVAVRDAAAHAAAMGMSAAYLVRDAAARSNSDWAPGGLAARARLRGLRGAALARPRRASPSWWSATARSRGGWLRASSGEVEVLNDVVLNQVLLGVDGGRDRASSRQEGTFWAGGTVWHGRAGAALLRLELVDHGGRHRLQRRRDPQRGRRARG